jgi:hypothetical protein
LTSFTLNRIPFFLSVVANSVTHKQFVKIVGVTKHISALAKPNQMASTSIASHYDDGNPQPFASAPLSKPEKRASISVSSQTERQLSTTYAALAQADQVPSTSKCSDVKRPKIRQTKKTSAKPRQKFSCPFPGCESFIVSIPRHLRENHDVPKETARVWKSVYLNETRKGAKATPAERNYDRRKPSVCTVCNVTLA